MREGFRFLGDKLDNLSKKDPLTAEEFSDTFRDEISGLRESLENTLQSTPHSVDNLHKTTKSATKLIKDTLDSISKTLKEQGNLLKRDETSKILISLDNLRKSLEKKELPVPDLEPIREEIHTSTSRLIKVTEQKNNNDIVNSIKNLESHIKKFKIPKQDFSDIISEIQKLRRSVEELPQPQIPDYSGAFQELGAKLESKLDVLIDKKMKFPAEFSLPKNQMDRLIGSWGGTRGEQLAARNVTLANVSATSADTEYSYTLPSRTVSFFVKLRAQGVLLYFAWVTGKLPQSGDGSAYKTVPQNGYHAPMGLDLGGKTIYFEVPSGSQVIEIETYQL